MNYRNQGPAVLHPRFLINFGASFCVIYGFTILDRKKGSGLWAYPKLSKNVISSLKVHACLIFDEYIRVPRGLVRTVELGVTFNFGKWNSG